MLRVIVTIFAFLTNFEIRSQCFELLYKRIDSLESLPYSLVDKVVRNVESGKTYTLMIPNVAYKTKLGFIFQTYGVSDTIDVILSTLNRKVLEKKTITNGDCILRHDPFMRSENYFLIMKTKKSNVPLRGCVGILILERVKKKAFRKLQRIEWVESDSN